MMEKDQLVLVMDEFAASLARIADLKKGSKWPQVAAIVGKRLRLLLGGEYNDLVKLTEIEMLARIASGGPTAWVPYKLVMLIALLKEAGDFADAQYPPRGGYGWHLKALHLLLDALPGGAFNKYLELAPEIEVLVAALGEADLPLRTQLLLMREYERRGDFANARDQFRAAHQKMPQNPKLLDFGIAFFERLSGENDAALSAGGLSRSEIQSYLAELLRSKSSLPFSPV